MSAQSLYMQPFLGEEDAQNMVAIAQSFGSFGTYAVESTSESLGEKLPQRFDAALNYINAGINGEGNEEDPIKAVSRTNYFRETYAYGEDVSAAGIEALLHHPQLAKTASDISGCTIIEPAIVYANILVPGQELAIHTDVPEFRGANRKVLPQWLLVTMLHSGLFDAWRIPIATCVAWFGANQGGAFTYYPNGISGARECITSDFNTAVILDTDQVFHGVERVAQKRVDVPTIGKDTRLHHMGADQWQLREGDDVLSNYDWEELRYSISWKAYCFKDEAEQQQWQNGDDELSLEFILDTLEKELHTRGVITGDRPNPTDFALQLVGTFVQFPKNV